MVRAAESEEASTIAGGVTVHCVGRVSGCAGHHSLPIPDGDSEVWRVSSQFWVVVLVVSHEDGRRHFGVVSHGACMAGVVACRAFSECTGRSKAFLFGCDADISLVGVVASLAPRPCLFASGSSSYKRSRSWIDDCWGISICPAQFKWQEDHHIFWETDLITCDFCNGLLVLRRCSFLRVGFLCCPQADSRCVRKTMSGQSGPSAENTTWNLLQHTTDIGFLITAGAHLHTLTRFV